MTKTVKGQKFFLRMNIVFALSCLILWKLNMSMKYSWLYVVAYLCCTVPVMFDVIFKGFAFPILKDFRVERKNKIALFVIILTLLLCILYCIRDFTLIKFCVICSLIIPGVIMQIDAIKKNVTNKRGNNE